MKLFNRLSNRSKGFTLIELLIVIALIGALAVGLIAALDPIEQLNRGRDTATRDVAVQFYNAQNRYYSAKGSFTNGLTTSAALLSVAALVDDYTNDLTAAGELKAQFATQASSNGANGRIYASVDAASPNSTAIRVCFSPQSKQFRTDVKNAYTNTGGTDATCVGAAATVGVASCFTCIQ